MSIAWLYQREEVDRPVGRITTRLRVYVIDTMRVEACAHQTHLNSESFCESGEGVRLPREKG